MKLFEKKVALNIKWRKYANIKLLWMSWSNCLICILLRYSIDRHTDLDRFFTINPEDGFIKTTKPLDREETAWLNISVFAAEIRKYFPEDFDLTLLNINSSDCSL